MAHYDVHGHRKQRFDGHDMKEPTYGAAIIGYSAKSESYSASTEQIVKMSGYPYSNPPTHDQIWPRSSARIQPKKGDDYDYDYDHPYSPKFNHPHPHDSAHVSFQSPPTGQYPSMYGHSPHDSPRKSFHSPPKGQFPGMYSHSPHDSPRKIFRANHGSDDSSSSDGPDGEDVECPDGVCYPRPKHGQDYNKDKNKANGYTYGPGNYPIMNSRDRHAIKESQYQVTDPRKYHNTQILPEPNNHNKPVTDAYYDRPSYPTNNDNNRGNYTAPAPIKTRPDHHRDARNSPVAGATHWTPFSGSPRKEHQEAMDSTEAQRRHGGAPQQTDNRFMKTTDSETLAKMFGGVFVK